MRSGRRGREVGRVGGHEEVGAEVEVALRPPRRVRRRSASAELDVGDDRAALLREAGLVEPAGRTPVERAAAARTCEIVVTPVPPMPGEAHDGVVGDGPGRPARSGQRLRRGAVEPCAGFASRSRAGLDDGERRAVAVEAGVVLVARRLVDAGLAAELGLDRVTERQFDFCPQSPQPSQTRSLMTTRVVGSAQRAALALAALLGRALLVVDQHGDAGGVGERPAAPRRCASRSQTTTPLASRTPR